MADVFGRADSPFNGAFSAEGSELFFGDAAGGIDGKGNLVQSMNVQYQQPVSTLFEIGSDFRYYVVGRTSGQMSLEKILGPVASTEALLVRLGNPCLGGSRALNLTLHGVGCTDAVRAGGAVRLRADACVATNLGFGLQAQDLLLRESVQIIFGQLSRGVQAPAQIGRAR